MKNKLTIAALAATLCIALPQVASAEVPAIAKPGDTRMVEFPYDPNNSYTVLTRPGSVTDIHLHEDETLVALAVGDTVQWNTQDVPGHVFIKPIFPNLVTSATLVTTKRTYQLNLRSSPENGKFYQQVGWAYPQLVAIQRQQAAQRLATMEAAQQVERDRLAATVVTSGVSIEALNFDYVIDGDAEFKPQQVFDDGKFTWIRMGSSQEMPALFLLNGENEAELLNFTMRDQYLVVHRLVDRLLMKLGDEKLTITNRKRHKSSFFNWGGTN